MMNWERDPGRHQPYNDKQGSSGRGGMSSTEREREREGGSRETSNQSKPTNGTRKEETKAKAPCSPTTT